MHTDIVGLDRSAEFARSNSDGVPEQLSSCGAIHRVWHFSRGCLPGPTESKPKGMTCCRSSPALDEGDIESRISGYSPTNECFERPGGIVPVLRSLNVARTEKQYGLDLQKH